MLRTPTAAESGNAHSLSKMASDSSLSGTSKRAKKKGAAAAATVATPTAVSTPEPTGSVHEFDGEDKKHSNPYIDVVSKKLRALRKKAQKLEKYDQMDKKDLNADQLLSLEKKPELVCQLKELEEVIKVLNVVDAEEAENAKRRQKLQESEVAAKVAAAVKEVNDAHAANGKATVRLLYALQNTIANIGASTISLTEEEYTALNSLRAYLTGAGLEAESVDKYIEVAEIYLHKYLNREDEEFVNRLTYANLRDLVDRLHDPPAAPSFVVLEDPNTLVEADETESARDLSTVDSVAHAEEIKQSAQQDSFGPVASTIISFFNPSELMTDEVASFAQSESADDVNGIVKDVPEEYVPEAALESEVNATVDEPNPEIAAAYEPATSSTPEPGTTPQQAQANGVQRSNSSRSNYRGNGRGGYRGGRGGFQQRSYDNNQQFHHHSPQQQFRVQQPRSHAFNGRGGYQGKAGASPGGSYRGSPQSPQAQGVRN